MTLVKFKQFKLKLKSLSEVVSNQISPDIAIDQKVMMEKCVKGACKSKIKKKK